MHRPDSGQPESSLAARHPATAARMASVLCFVAAGTTAILPLLGSAPAGSATQVVTYAVPLVLLVLGLALPRVRGWLLHALLLLTPLAGIAVIAALDVTTNDATAAGQVFLCFPVLLAASQLRAAAAALVTLAAVTADAIVVFTLQTPTQALTDFVFVSTTLVMIAGLLTTAGIRQDRLVAQLQQQAAIDPLTGLVTRRVLDDALQCALTGATSTLGTALVLVDLDHFKRINDTHGHPIGDDVLAHAATLLRERAGPDCVVGRIGGDEMAVLIPGCSPAQARRCAEDLAATVRCRPLPLPDGEQVTISASIGLAHAPQGSSSLRELYAAADASLYAAKHSGRDRVGTATAGG